MNRWKMFGAKGKIKAGVVGLFILVFPFFPQIGFSYPWPISVQGAGTISAPTSTPQNIRDNLGSFRNTGTPHFHDGVDIVPLSAYGTSVYCAVAGNVIRSDRRELYNDYIQVGNLLYMHVQVSTSQSVEDDHHVRQGKYLGRILRPEAFSQSVIPHTVTDHVHFRQYMDGIAGPRMNPLLYLDLIDGGDIETHASSTLQIFEDNLEPVINTVTFYRAGETIKVANFNDFWGTFDILVRGYDQVPDVHNMSARIQSDHAFVDYLGHNTPYQMGYQVLESTSTGDRTIFNRFDYMNYETGGRPAIMFDRCPPAGASTTRKIFKLGSSWDRKLFWVTNETRSVLGSGLEMSVYV